MRTSTLLKNTARSISLPFLAQGAVRLRDEVYARERSALPRAEYVPEGWVREKDVKGWNAPGVLDAFRSRWLIFSRVLPAPRQVLKG